MSFANRSLAAGLAQAYACGALGGLANGLAVWSLGALGVTAAFGVAIAPDLTPAWLYPRLVWGGLWAGVFLLPLARNWSWWRRGLLFSLGPTLVAGFLVFPIKAGAGLFGYELGLATPLFILGFNAAWGLATAGALETLCRGPARPRAPSGVARAAA